MALLNRCSYKISEEICDRLNVPLKERSILLDNRYKAEKKLYLIENTSHFTQQDLYWALIHFNTEYILYMMALAKDEEIKKAISNFYTHQRNIRPYIKGRDLVKIGLKPGPVFTDILNQVLNAKLDGRLKTKREEIQFAEQVAKKTNVLIK
jgi:tRNA nucleotidyltransferase (CCA-adding enzyme)